MVVKKVNATNEEKAILAAQAAKAEKQAKIQAASLSVKDTKEMLQLAFGMAKIVKEAKANDGIFSPADLILLTQLFPLVGPAIDGADMILKEMKDLSTEEANDLLKFTAASLGGAFDSKEMIAKVEAGIELAMAIVKMIKILR